MYSVLNIPDKACEYLWTSVEKGYKNWDYRKKDKGFDNIRAVSCYKAIDKELPIYKMLNKITAIRKKINETIQVF